MKRVMIIGSGGAGKSTLAMKMAEITCLPLTHLDKVFWQSNWQEPDKSWWSQKVAELANEENWILDGNYGGTMAIRLEKADTVIFMDYPSWIKVWRVLKRFWLNRKKSRPDMPEDCPEQIDWPFIHYVANYNKSRKPGIMKKLANLRSDQKAIILKNDKQTCAFLQSLIQTYAKS